MSEETKLQNAVMDAVNRRIDARLFRNNVGMCNERNIGLQYGLRKGSSDLIGWIKKRITPDMVGKDVAVFTAVEIKVQNRKPSKAQKIFIDNVKRFGGIVVIVRDIKDLKKIFGEEE